MAWIFSPILNVPRVTMKKFEDLVEEVTYIESGRELDGTQARVMAEQLMIRVLNEYVDQHFGESARSAAEMFINRKRMERMLCD
ncbi:hypothetical protein [Alicyclobacillus fastidiosus]|uniref:Uncharacterized protein n=1 Tax=Alicyclobacillus fastidiosus TaxID=392011 RepID=A0ABV5AIA1_9BACL|nr:hypothetical protein [Alicyclobacillus fastidiosus]WEH11114.1 hypothetical protein PYS47_07820 [Alicyclobacillus fastidiosus]